MLNAGAQPHGVMEGKGSYNRHAKLPAGGAALAIPLLEKAVQSLELEPEEQLIVIADYGSSQGKNSMAPMQVAIRGLRNRIGPDRAISIFHIDQPSNDCRPLRNGACLDLRLGLWLFVRTFYWVVQPSVLVFGPSSAAAGIL